MLLINNEEILKKNKFVTAKEFYCYQLMIRKPGQWIHRIERLFHQYFTDNFAKIENLRLLYI